MCYTTSYHTMWHQLSVTTEDSNIPDLSKLKGSLSVHFTKLIMNHQNTQTAAEELMCPWQTLVKTCPGLMSIDTT